MPQPCTVEVHIPTLDSDKRETPRGKRVASESISSGLVVAAIVKYHGTSPWHLRLLSKGGRDKPRKKHFLIKMVPACKAPEPGRLLVSLPVKSRKRFRLSFHSLIYETLMQIHMPQPLRDFLVSV